MDIYTMNTDGSKVERLTNNDSTIFQGRSLLTEQRCSIQALD